MKKKPASRSAFFNPRVLFGFGVVSMGFFVALFAFARPGAPVKSPAQNQSEIAASNLAGDNFAAQSGPVDELPALQMPQEFTRANITVPSQASSCSLTVLATDGSTSGNARAPSTRFAGSRAVYLLTASELASAGLVNGTMPTFLGWTYAAAPATGGS